MQTFLKTKTDFSSMTEKTQEKTKLSDIDHIKASLDKLKKHKEKNKTDKSMLRAILRKQAKLKKLQEKAR